MIVNDASVINTQRIRIIPLRKTELKMVCEGGKEVDMALGLDCPVTVEDPHLRAAYGEMLSDCENHPDEICWHTLWLIVLKTENSAVGSAAFMNLKKSDSSAEIEIGYGIDEKFRGKHIACEVVAAMCGRAFGCGFTRLVARAEPENVTSQAVLVHCGFKKCGKTDGEYVYELVNDKNA